MKHSFLYTTEIKDQRAIKPVDIDSMKKLFIFFFLILPFFVLSFLILKVNLKIYSIGKEIRKIEYEVRKLEDQKIKLILEKENLLHPKNIEDFSKKSGLVPAEEGKVILYYEP